MGCGPLTALPLMKIPELVELVGLASLVSHRISPDTVRLSFRVAKGLVVGTEAPRWGPRGQDTPPQRRSC